MSFLDNLPEWGILFVSVISVVVSKWFYDTQTKQNKIERIHRLLDRLELDVSSFVEPVKMYKGKEEPKFVEFRGVPAISYSLSQLFPKLSDTQLDTFAFAQSDNLRHIWSIVRGVEYVEDLIGKSRLV